MELISREDAIKTARTMIGLTADERENEIRAIPTVEEREEGEWIHDIHYGLKLPEHRCSICGEWEYSDTESKYCPNCGARMKGE